MTVSREGIHTKRKKENSGRRYAIWNLAKKGLEEKVDNDLKGWKIRCKEEIKGGR